VPGLVEIVTDDFEWVTWKGALQPTVYRGAGGLESYFRDADVWEVVNLEIGEFRDLGDSVLLVGVFHARGGGSGVEIDGRITQCSSWTAANWRAFSASEARPRPSPPQSGGHSARRLPVLDARRAPTPRAQRARSRLCRAVRR
jgi:hypothetical protein